MRGHIIVCGEDALAMRIIDELNDAELSVVHLGSPTALDAAGISGAQAVIAADADDAVNLEVALLARQSNPDVRVVARLSNPVLLQAMNDGIGPGAVLDVADLAAPSVVEALLGRTAHPIRAGGVDFVVSSDAAPRRGTLRELYGRLAPVAIVRGENAPDPGKVIACPALDEKVYPGDRTTMMGRADELDEQGVRVSTPAEGAALHRSPPVRAFDTVRAFHEDMNPLFYWALGIATTLLIGSTVILRFAIRPTIGWVDALSFATETLTTVGYGNFNFMGQELWLRLWGVLMMLSGIAMISVMVAFVADVLLSRRLPQAASRQQVSHLHRHIVVVGLGSFGIRVATILKDAGHAVAVIERDEDNRYLSAAAELQVPVITGDATLRTTLAAARAEHASAVAVLTEDDMVNIETGLVLRELTDSPQASGSTRIPIVLRIYDRALGAAVGHRLDFNHVRSTVELATPWFIGAAMGIDVLGTFSVGQRSFMVGGVVIRPGSELDGTTIAELSTQTRVIAVERDGGTAELHPRRSTRFRAGDTAYLVGPYHELLDTLRRGQPTHRPHRPEPAVGNVERLTLGLGGGLVGGSGDAEHP
jgi:Trk K+ transport system NAD-binding subunit